jgi:hypothetical protein
MPPFKNREEVVMPRFAVVTAMQHYVGRIRTIRNEIRTERMLNGLSPHIRADIGWPDRYGRVRGFSD